MALYTNEDATLDSINGHGYAFLNPAFPEDKYKGVFFSEEENMDSLKSLLDDAKVEFSGVAFRKTQAGTIRSQTKTFLVDVKTVVTVSAGVRADFNVVEEVKETS